MKEHSIELCMRALQLGKKLAAQRKQLRLHRHPLKTLYYFSACAASAAVRGCLWLAKHRITLTLLLPAVIGYVFLKQTGTPSCPELVYGHEYGQSPC